MKINLKQLIFPKLQYFDYINYDLNFIKIKPKAFSKGYILMDKTKPYIKKTKRKPPIPKQSLDLECHHGNKIFKSHRSLSNKLRIDYNLNTTRSNYFMTMKEKRMNEKQFEGKVKFLCENIEIQPTIKHIGCSLSKKKINSALLPKEIKQKQNKNYLKIPYLFRNSSYNHLLLKGIDSEESNRYAKPKINIDAIIQNYNSNAKRIFSCEKVKMYQIKVSPFLYKNSKRINL